MSKKQREITIRDMAIMLQLSIATVSRALNHDPTVRAQTKKRVLKLAEEIGYRTNDHARKLKQSRSHTIGCIVPRLDSYLMASLVSGMEKSARVANQSLVIMQSNGLAEAEASCANILLNKMVDGLLVVVSDSTRLAHFKSFIERKIPVILLNGAEEEPPFVNITIDHAKAGYEITRHFLGQGRKRIVHVSAQGPESAYSEIRKGYRRALAEACMPIPERYIIKGGVSRDDGVRAAESILQWRQRPDAIIAISDECAVGCITVLKEHGIKIPADIAISGFGNDPVSSVTRPTLTTFNYPSRQMGESAIQELILQLEGSMYNKLIQSIVLRSDLIVRESG